MRILFLSDNFPPETNAPASRTYEHAKRWVREAHDVTVITCAPNFPDGRLFGGYRNRWRQVENVDGIRVVRVKTYIAANEGFVKRTLDYMSFMVAGFAAGLLEARPHAVVATSPQFFCAVGGWALAAVRRVPFVFELRDLWPATIVAIGALRSRALIRCLERVELFLYRRARLIVPVSDAFRHDLVTRGIDPKKITVIVNGVDHVKFRPMAKDAALLEQYALKDKFVVGYIGTHGMCHGLESVVAAAERLLHRSDIAFLFVGGGAERASVEAMVRQKCLSNVRLVLAQPKEAMPRHWSVCDVSLVPLRDAELFSTVIPSKIFECMGMGLPMIVSVPRGEATRLVEAAGAGIIVRPERPDEIAQAIERLTADSQLHLGLKRAALLSASLYSRDDLARKMITAIAGVTPSARRRLADSGEVKHDR